MGRFDLPAAFAYVLAHQDAASSGKLFYVGHSMGTTMFWVAAAEQPALVRDSVHAMVALGPVAFVGHMASPLRMLAPFSTQLEVRDVM